MNRSYIVMTGYAAGKAAARLAADNRETLKKYYSISYIDRMIRSGEPDLTDENTTDVSVEFLMTCPGIKRKIERGDPRGAEDCENTSVPAVYPAAGGGIYRGLWNICEDFRCGIRVDIRDIPIKQETVEICNHFDTDPYTSDDESVYLMVASKLHPLIDHLAAHGIYAAPVGYLTEERARMIVIGDNVRYLNRPKIQEENT